MRPWQGPGLTRSSRSSKWVKISQCSCTHPANLAEFHRSTCGENLREKSYIDVRCLTILVLWWLLRGMADLKTAWENIFFLVAMGAQRTEDKPTHAGLMYSFITALSSVFARRSPRSVAFNLFCSGQIHFLWHNHANMLVLLTKFSLQSTCIRCILMFSL